MLASSMINREALRRCYTGAALPERVLRFIWQRKGARLAR